MTSFAGSTRPADTLGLRVTRAPQNQLARRLLRGLGQIVAALLFVELWRALVTDTPVSRYAARVSEGLRALGATVRDGLPWTATAPEVRAYRRANFRNMLGDVGILALGILITSRKNYGVLRLVLRRASGELLDFGVVSHRLVTTAGVDKIVSVLNTADAVTGINFKYHAIGTGATAPVIGNTALQTEATTQYAADNTRPTGTQTVGATNNVYRSVGTNTVDATIAVTEMGLMSQAATGGGTLLDRFTFTAVNLVSGDSLQTTVDITFPAGS